MQYTQENHPFFMNRYIKKYALVFFCIISGFLLGASQYLWGFFSFFGIVGLFPVVSRSSTSTKTSPYLFGMIIGFSEGLWSFPIIHYHWIFYVWIILVCIIQKACFVAHASWIYQRFPRTYPLLMSISWISIEYILQKIPFGSFTLLGESLALYPDFLEVARYFGAFGISFLIVLLGISFSSISSSSLFTKPKNKNILLSRFISIGMICMVAFLLCLKFFLSLYEKSEAKPVFISLIQPGKYALERLESDNTKKNIFFDFLFSQISLASKLSKETNTSHIIILPETSVDLTLSHDVQWLNSLKNQKISEDTFFIFGAKTLSKQFLASNSAVLFNNEFSQMDETEKVMIIPIAENEFYPAESYKILHAPFAKIGSPICIEGQYSLVVKNFLSLHANLLVFLSSTRGFQIELPIETLGNFQLRRAIFRAIEFNRFVAYINTFGPSALISNEGKILDFLDVKQSNTISGYVSLSDTNTWYFYYGEHIIGMTVIIMFLLTLVVVLKQRFLRG